MERGRGDPLSGPWINLPLFAMMRECDAQGKAGVQLIRPTVGF